jgi:hypothetical protein
VTLNASGPISLGGSTAGQSINLELGRSATAQVSLNESAVRTLAGVPSGAIVMPTDFYGKSSAVFRLDAAGYSDFGAISIQPAEVAFRVNSDGTVEASTFGSGIVDSYNWITPTTGSTTYFVRATLNSGSLNSGTTGVWEALTTDRVWTVYKNEFTSGSQIANLTIAISSNSGGTNIVASANISLEATVT